MRSGPAEIVQGGRIRRDLASRGIKVAMSYLVTQLERAPIFLDR